MATLNIGGQRVKVDDAFLSMSPDQQQQAVEEIASQLGRGAPQQPAPWEGQNVQQLRGTVTPQGQQPQQQLQPNLAGATAATINGIVNSVPYIGTMATDITDRLASRIDQIGGANYDEALQGRQQRRDAVNQANPIANVAGQVAGGVGALGAAARVPALAGALGLTGGLPTRIAASAASSAGMAGGDALLRGEGGEDALRSMAMGGAIGGAVPAGTAGLGAAARGIGNRVVPTIRGAFNRDNEAIRRVSGAYDMDVRSGASPMMTQADEAMARSAGAPVVNADRGGQNVRTLARTAANISPTADGAFKRLTDDRFATQGTRATSFLRRIMGGNVDDIGVQDRISAAARNANNPAYRRAYEAPAAQAVWNPNIRRLMQSDVFRRAINEAETVGTDVAAIQGQRAVRNPFVFGQDGSIGFRRMPDGSTARPNLAFWDIVQRNLRKVRDTAARSGDNETASRAGQLRDMLNRELDGLVPEFNQARRGAARFFEAEDALDAGRLFARQPKSIPEARRAHAQFTPEEREVFAVGYASELIDNIKATRDRVNVINNVFGSQASRESVELALGPQRAREVEAFVRMETILDQLRTAVSGNSTTAKQLIAAGVVGGGVSALQGGDLTNIASSAALFAAGRRGLQVMGKAVDDRVMQRVAEMLSDQDPAMLSRAIHNATLSRQHMQALEAISRGLEIAGRSAGMTAISAN